MDFSKKGTARKQQYIRSVSRKVATKASVTVFRLFMVGLVSLIIIGSYLGFGVLKGLADSAPNIDQIEVKPSGFTTNIYDKDGNLIDTLIGAESNRVYVEISQIPKVLQDCVISIEDERFYEHNGIDVQGIFRAFFVGLKSGDFGQGASTITQQLIKNQVFEGGAEDNFTDRFIRKVQEQYLAIQLEQKMSKEQILEYYLNTINFGAGTYGVQTASKRYFNKDVEEITLSEAAVIAAIAQSPTNMNPINHPENNAQRRAQILESMKRLNLCTEEEYAQALSDDVYSRIQVVNDEQDVTSYNTYFVDELIEQVIADLQEEKGYTYTQASKALYSGGLNIYTTLDSKIQSVLDDVYTNEDYFPKIGTDSYWELTYALSIEKKNGKQIHYHTNDLLDFSHLTTAYFSSKEAAEELIEQFKAAKVETDDIILAENNSLIIQPQSSMVIMDQHTGYVVGLIGGRGEKTGNRTLNRATNTTRQPGSTFKILSTYLPALDSAGMTLATVIDDAPYQYPGSDKYVSNWSGDDYEGLTTLRRAILRSKNVVTVKTLEKVTPKVGFDYLQKLGFTTLVESGVSESGKTYSDINLPLALGGITKGVSNLELTAAYASIANGGVYSKPIFYTKILDSNNKVLLNKKTSVRQVMMESTAFLLTNAMEDVVKKGTGTLVGFKNLKMPVAGKTGTTTDDKDLWFAGYTPYYTATIWSGYDNNKAQTNTSYQKIIWRDVMERIHKENGLEAVPFNKPDSIVERTICTKSGKLAVEGLCNKYEGGSTVKTEYFAKNTEPTDKCDIHVAVKICTTSGKIATEFCPPSTVVEKVLLFKEETAKTLDTPFLLPGNEDTCTVHNARNSGLQNLLPTPGGTTPSVTTAPPNTNNSGNGNSNGNNGSNGNGNTNGNGNGNGNSNGNNGNGNNSNTGGEEDYYDPEFDYDYGD
ncbi:PBP1A family penicillin-binding protein [Anaerocolumna sp. AGMB13020]|uniref:transglycosylase domain-containing protein n=1 Tax=Anaerocolumna sp. AGMB13020 TaxID=3081750 RepID=UPI002955D110|nr:PBP1A family penicillin-binding protein [Anaerocolumna sp. AGMB13020]WOO38443.1 PBP1A family penicillin-binding protein [Anaerocolumna sp. AGMB13020]